MEIVN